MEPRTAISVVRCAPLASSRFAILAQAISSTSPVIPSSRRIGVRESSWTELCPFSPGSTVSRFCRNSASVWSLIPVCSGASTSLMIEL